MQENTSTILVVEDDKETRRNIEITLTRAGYDVVTAADSTSALILIENRSFQTILLDVMMPDWTRRLSQTAGLNLLKEIRQRGIQTPVVMLTGSSSVGTAVEAMKFGAFDYLEKGSVSSQEFIEKIQAALETQPTPNLQSPSNWHTPLDNQQPGWKKWLIERSGGLVDEVVGAAVVGGLLYLLGVVAGIFDGGQQKIIIYASISLVVVAALLIIYVMWQRRNRK